VDTAFYQILFMMPNKQTDILFQLIHTLEKAEKRHFKLYIKRSSARQDLKIVQLFDALDKLHTYDEKLLLKKLSSTEKPQLHNLKAHLYREILASLRLLKSADSIDLQLNEQFDYAHILYKKGLFAQSLRIVEKAKETARTNEKLNHLTQLIALEKRIETLHITRSLHEKSGLLAAEAIETINRSQNMVQLSNLALQLYSWYIKNGHTRNKEDEKDIRIFFKENMPANAAALDGFYEKLYLYQSYSTYAFIRQDFLQYYRYSQKWVDLFTSNPLMIRVETGHYIKGLHNLMNAHFDLRNHQQFALTIKKFEAFAKTDRVIQHENFLVQTFIYIHIAKINQHFMQGTFAEGLLLVPHIEANLQQYHLLIDRHRILVFNYKTASLYFGNGDYSTCIDYLQRIINDSIDLRYDLQCYARLLHLMAHYEMGNFDIIEHLVKSVYRFMARMKNFTVVEEEMFRFLKHAIKITPGELKAEMANFLSKIKKFEKSRFETRSFAYLDVISWLESKVQNKPVSEIIHQKYLQGRKRNYPEPEE
jgi:hypothetical protein